MADVVRQSELLSSTRARWPGHESVSILGTVATILVDGKQTGGAWSLIEIAAEETPRERTLMHMHADAAQCYLVLEGTMAYCIDGVEGHCGPGESVYIPPGAMHQTWQLHPGIGRMLLATMPAGIEQVYRSTGAPIDGLQEHSVVPGWDELERVSESVAKFNTFVHA